MKYAKRFKLLSHNTQNRQRTASTLSGIDGELERYKSETNNGVDCKIVTMEYSIGSVLSREQSYPLLAPIALDLISTPASEALSQAGIFCVWGFMCRKTKSYER